MMRISSLARAFPQRDHFQVAWANFLLLLGGLLLAGCQHQPPLRPDAPVRIRWSRDPESLAPTEQPNQNATDALNLITPSLLQLDPETKQMEPFLIEAHPLVTKRDDSLIVLTYQLRRQATWDNGRPLLAADMAFTLKFMFCPQLPVEQQRLELDFVKAIELDSQNPRRFSVVCLGYQSSNALAVGDIVLLAEAGLDPKGTLRSYSMGQVRNPGAAAQKALASVAARYLALQPARHPDRLPGCGAYRLASWQAGTELRFIRRPFWWGDSLRAQAVRFVANPQELRYKIIPEDVSALLALRRGEIDVYPNVPAPLFAKLRQTSAAAKQLRFYTTLTRDVVYMGFNTSHPALHDTATRHALAYLVDAAKLCQATQLGAGRLSTGIISPLDKANYNDSLPLLPYNPSLASTRLQQAGWQHRTTGWYRGDQLLRLVVRYRAGDMNYELMALQFAAAAKAMGILIDLRPTEASLYTKSLHDGDFDLYIHTMKGNPFRFNFLPFLGTGSIGLGNVTRFGNAASDRLLTLLAAADSPVRQAHLLRKFQVLLREQLPLVPLFFVANRIAANRNLGGLHVTNLKPGYQASAMSW
jgi:ABC-type transport system substrate-binding protein